MNQIELYNQVIELVRVPTGVFMMGTANQWFGEAPVHSVTIEKSFYLSKTPITQAVWRAVMSRNPSRFLGSDTLPVDSVNFEDACAFCRQLSHATNRLIRLPTEAEWEYACRAGTNTEFFMFSDTTKYRDGSEIPLSLALKICDFAWIDLNSQDRTHPVSEKLPNPWGLYDMIGNVWEWCQDVWHDNYLGAPTNGNAWLDGHEVSSRRCVRGGAWDMDAFRCRSAYRSYDDKMIGTTRSGLRIAIG